MSAFIHGKLLAPVSGIQIINLQRNPALGVQFHVLPEDHYLMFCPAAADDLVICLRFTITVFPNCLLYAKLVFGNTYLLQFLEEFGD